MKNPVLLLLYRNLTTSVDKVFLLWQLIFPIVYIFIAGYAYSGLIAEGSIKVGGVSVSYPAFLAVGMIGFSVMNSSTVAGSIIWNDKRNGMFQQLLVMPFTRTEYIAGNLATIVLMGLGTAALIIIAGIPTMLEVSYPSFAGVAYTIYALVAGSIFFGSITIIISTRLKTSEGFNVIVNGIFLFFSFASSAFYPTDGVPEALRTAFYVNPLTHVIDIMRDGIFSQIDTFTNIQVGIVSAMALAAFLVALVSMKRVRV